MVEIYNDANEEYLLDKKYKSRDIELKNTDTYTQLADEYYTVKLATPYDLKLEVEKLHGVGTGDTFLSEYANITFENSEIYSLRSPQGDPICSLVKNDNSLFLFNETFNKSEDDLIDKAPYILDAIYQNNLDKLCITDANRIGMDWCNGAFYNVKTRESPIKYSATYQNINAEKINCAKKELENQVELFDEVMGNFDNFPNMARYLIKYSELCLIAQEFPNEDVVKKIKSCPLAPLGKNRDVYNETVKRKNDILEQSEQVTSQNVYRDRSYIAEYIVLSFIANGMSSNDSVRRYDKNAAGKFIEIDNAINLEKNENHNLLVTKDIDSLSYKKMQELKRLR